MPRLSNPTRPRLSACFHPSVPLAPLSLSSSHASAPPAPRSLPRIKMADDSLLPPLAEAEGEPHAQVRMPGLLLEPPWLHSRRRPACRRSCRSLIPPAAVCRPSGERGRGGRVHGALAAELPRGHRGVAGGGTGEQSRGRRGKLQAPPPLPLVVAGSTHPSRRPSRATFQSALLPAAREINLGINHIGAQMQQAVSDSREQWMGGKS